MRLKQPDGKTFIESRIGQVHKAISVSKKPFPPRPPLAVVASEFRTDPASKDAVQGMSLPSGIPARAHEAGYLDSDAPVLRPGQPFRLQAKGAYLYGAAGCRQPLHRQTGGTRGPASAGGVEELVL